MSELSGIDQLKKNEDAKFIVINNKWQMVLLLVSSHCRGLHDHHHSVLGYECVVTNIFKPSAVLPIGVRI